MSFGLHCSATSTVATSTISHPLTGQCLIIDARLSVSCASATGNRDGIGMDRSYGKGVNWTVNENIRDVHHKRPCCTERVVT